jgi:hypothetical protein
MFIRKPSRMTRRAHTLAPVLAGTLLLASCQSLMPLDTSSLDRAGMTYDSIKVLKALHISQPEVLEIAEARQAGLPDSDCVALLQIFHDRHEQFTAAKAVVGMLHSGMRDGIILGLANMDQLGLGSGELQAMHLAGLSDEIILEVAHRHASGQPVLSGASLATMRNARLDNATLLELVRRGVPNSETVDIVTLRHSGNSDAEILHRLPAQ